ncbi:DUF2235 domain-containing protein [Marimonas sp. MJW-29]|uniref:DUF2235 domain-containing protein n=1 Tax=Sulfitobacter sediminis TaxID=3234186 RepID=A0ABV3RK89_9RHOB
MGSGSQPSNGKAGGERPPTTHVIILDGTLSSLVPLCQTNAARTYMLLREVGRSVSIYYEPGLQWDNWRSIRDVITGKGINRQIRRAYGWLASRYRPGDRIFLFGYSRGAYAVRSLAGVIDLVGLLRPEHTTHQNVREAYRHYELSLFSPTARAFIEHRCHERVEIDMIGVWDTVKSLGINAPLLWRLSEARHAFHNHDLSSIVKHGYHALAHDETRVAFKPVLWQCHDAFAGRIEQVWFPGAHGDVGGQLGGYEAARPLANIPLVWMLHCAAQSGLPLPDGWEARFPRDAMAPVRGTWRGHGKVLMSRRKRIIGADRSERLHESVQTRMAAREKLTASERAVLLGSPGTEG